ncbi:penicillin-binding protein activator LpoB [Delftia sp. HK171]|jgi:TolB-like protein|uniref:transporter n=1 Tax=Delftia TaxID=80865 RepID=UPI000452AAD3|nr:MULTISPECIES: transporter [Delftia]APE50986.1 penicillin-binding protein activator LpoB [Delftia sp. HK171]EZP54070.1 putative lipoprotein [Delftia sp. RIT313]MBD9584384.1 penicillin-binding protein activator LpoB [Delftia sp. DLF01]MBJ2140862.1 penicillin-binding protein activator LpoB [Delftia acidovorans]MBK0114325.1 penicillin-binding protein activator LpoB [Delftia sp. S65]
MTHRTTFASRLRVLTGIALVGLLSACSTIDRGTAPALETNASWAVLPFENHTETPMAGNRAAAIATALINARGVGQVKRYTGDALQETLFDGREAKRRDDALAWARGEGVRYALTGAVDEWRYKVGVDGEPAVGVTLEIVDVGTGATVWSGAGAQSGWSREALAAVGQKLIRNLLGTGLANAR